MSRGCIRGCSQPLAVIRRVEQHQQTLVNWLYPADQSPLETTIGFEQVAIEVTAASRSTSPIATSRQVYRFGLLEDFDHLYRFAALMDRLEGKDANAILQCYTDILPGPADRGRAPRTRSTICAARTTAQHAAAADQAPRADDHGRPSTRRTTTT